MSDEKKTKKQLIAELQEARRRLQALESAQAAQGTLVQNALLRDFADQLGEGIVIMDQEGCIILWNKYFESLSGLSAEELNGKPIWELQDDTTLKSRRTAEHIQKSVLEFFKTGEGSWLNRSFKTKYAMPDGSYKILDDKKFAIRTAEGLFLGGILRDLTQLEETKQQLEKSEDRLSKIRIAANDGVWDWDLLTNDIYFDPRYYTMAGYDVDEFPHQLQEFQKRVHPDDLEKVMENIYDHLEGKTDRFVVEFRFLKKDGGWMWLLGRGMIVDHDENEAPTRFVGTHTDITRQVSALQKLRESEEKFRILYNQSPDMYASVSPEDNRILMCNDTFLRKMGYERDEVLGALIFDMYHEAALPLAKETCEELKKVGKLRGKELILKKKDGSKINVSLNADAFKDDAGNILYSMASWRDITEDKKMQQALLDSESKFRLLADYTLDWEYWLDRESGQYLYISPACEQITGYSPREITDNPALFFEMVDPNYRDDIRKHYEDDAAYHQHDSFTMQFPIITKFGEERWIEHRCQPIFDDNGDYVGRRGNNHDITERKLNEFAVKESEEKFSRSFYLHPTPMQIIDLGTGIRVGANDSFCELFGYEREEIIGMPIASIQLIKNKADDQTSWQILEEKGEIRNHPIEMLTKNGDVKNMLLSAAKIVLSDTTLVIGSFVDITERVQAEEKLRLQSHALESVASGITITNAHGTIVWTNPAFSKLTGYSFEEAAGQTPKILKSGQHSDDFYQEMWQTISAGKTWQGEITNKRKDGTLYLEEMIISPLVTEDKRISNFVASKQDISKRKEVEKNVQKNYARLNSLRKIDQAIANTLDVSVTMNILLKQLREQLNVDAAVVLSLDKALQSLKTIDAQGIPKDQNLTPTTLSIRKGYAGEVALSQKTLFIPDLLSDTRPWTKSFTKHGFISYYGIPLTSKGELIGVLEVMHRTPLAPDKEWEHYLQALAAQAALAIDNSTLFNNLQRSNMNLIRAYDKTIQGWAQALELRDMETEGHSQRVVGITMALAKAWGIKGEQLRHIQRGALLHDIGKMGIPDAILQKPGKLTNDEWEIMKLHPVYAYQWLSAIDYLRPALDIPYHHHERWDGTGYPLGLKGKQIPLAARLFAIADVWDALRSNRPYRKAWSEEKTLAYIQEQAETHFDPKVVALFANYIASPAYRSTQK